MDSQNAAVRRKGEMPLLRRNSTAFSDGAEPPDCVKLEEVEIGNLHSCQKHQPLFTSNPELQNVTEFFKDSQKKREILNTKISTVSNSVETEQRISSKERKKITANLKRYRRRSIQEVDSYAFQSLNKLYHHKCADVLVSWHNESTEPVELSDLELSRPASFVKGGQGFVYAVRDKIHRKEFALKMKLRDNKSRTAWLIEQREHQVLRTLRHEFVVSLYHYYCTREAIFLLTEFLDGGCLWSHVAHNGLMPEEATAYYSACIMEAVDYLHSNHIVYRDMKAENIVLDWNRRPKLIDFGMAKFLHGYEPTENKAMVTATQYYYAGYLAPEIYNQPEEANYQVDVWGIGYLITEIHLGFGVFRAMPWDKLPKKHLGPNWELTIPNDCIASLVCIDLLHNILRQDPQTRPSISDIRCHPFFRNIDWRTLRFQRGPNLKEIEFIPPRSSKPLRDSGEVTGNQNANCHRPQQSPAVEVTNQENIASRKDFIVNSTPLFMATVQLATTANRELIDSPDCDDSNTTDEDKEQTRFVTPSSSNVTPL